MLLRFIIAVALILAPPLSQASAAEQSLGQTIKKIFSTPTPTPHRKKKSTTAAKNKSPTPTPSPKKKSSPPAKEEEPPTPSPAASPRKKRIPAPEEETPAPTVTKKKISSTPSPTLSAHHKRKKSPTPEPLESPEASKSPIETPSPSPSRTPEQTPSPSPAKKQHPPNATLLPNQIKGFENYPLKVQKLLTSALDLTTQDLDYQYGSADPGNGGMDCSGFVYYVLKQNDIAGVPRDSSEQYVWLRRARLFEAVLSEKDDSFELEDLKPGDLLFWTGTYSIRRDPPITHAMIYLGREKRTGNRVMVGASDGRVYHGESRFGVSVFDFKIQPRDANGEGRLHPTFIGYGHLPGLQQ